MHITRHTDYALRVLIYVALKGEEQSTIGEIAERYAISKNHLMKIVQSLNAKGYLVAQRGKNGGLRLQGDPRHLSIGALVRDMEQDLALVECFENPGNCLITPACRLKQVLAEALEAFFQVLDRYTLADLLPSSRQPELIRLLGIAS